MDLFSAVKILGTLRFDSSIQGAINYVTANYKSNKLTPVCQIVKL